MQRNPTENGIYYMHGMTEMVRTPDFAKPEDVLPGKTVHVTGGATWRGLSFTLAQLQGPPNAEGFWPIMFQPTLHDLAPLPPPLPVMSSSSAPQQVLVTTTAGNGPALEWRPFVPREANPWKMSFHHHSVTFEGPENLEGFFTLLVLAHNNSFSRWGLVEQPFCIRSPANWMFAEASRTCVGCDSPPQPPPHVCEVQYSSTSPPRLFVRFIPSRRFDAMDASIVCSFEGGVSASFHNSERGNSCRKHHS